METPNKPRHASGLIALSLLCGAALHTPTAEAAIYTYVDKDGTRWLTNTPKKGKKYKLIAKYGAPQKPRPRESRGYSTPSIASSSEGIPRMHCGGMSQAQLEKRLAPHLGSIRTFAQAYGVEEKLVHAVMKQESCFNANARSQAGAMGLMQLMPGTADMMGIDDAWDPHQNIKGGIKYLARMLREFNGDKRLALAAYNAGPGAVRKYNGVPPYRETRNYVARIMGEYERLSGRQNTQQVAATGFQRSARVAPGIIWSKPVQEFTVFRGLTPDDV